MRAISVGAAVLVAGCGNTTSTPSQTGAADGPSRITPTASAPAGPAPCDPAVPDAACKLAGGLRPCKDGDPARVGEWRYALVVPAYAPVEDLPAARLAAIWRGDDKISLAASADTQEALAALLGPGKVGALATPPALDATHWAVLPAHELTPHHKVLTVDGVHPLDKAPGPLALPLCGEKGPGVRNIDPAKLTTLAMTGTTALTRYTGKLMDEKGVLYPLPAVEPWLAAADLVHISNEVSFVPKCDASGKATMSFCSKESYLELLEKSHAKIIELTGSHLIDYGRNWLEHTIALYEQRGWVWFGGGRSQLEGIEPRVVEHNGNKLAFLGCNMPYTDNKALSNGPGPAGCDLARMQWQIRDLARRGFVPIVSVQHDEVYKHDPPHGLVHDLRALAGAGAQYVMGSQAHCPHPWEMHKGAFVHYGPGNLYFDQFWHPVRDSAQDKLYIHAGKLLTVGHLYVRTEERGRPRVLDQRERDELLEDLAGAQARLPRGADPWGTPEAVPETRDRPDSVVVKGALQPITVRVPAKLEPGKRYPAVVELGGPPVTDDAAFVVTIGKRKVDVPRAKLAEAITALVAARYPVDAERITLNTPPEAKRPTKKPRR